MMKPAILLSIFAAALSLQLFFAEIARAQSMVPPGTSLPAEIESAGPQLMCADGIPPKGMVITATGTSPACGGACRSRKIEPATGLTMLICAGQPVPDGYTLDSVTSSPECSCLGEDANAYVIKMTEQEIARREQARKAASTGNAALGFAGTAGGARRSASSSGAAGGSSMPGFNINSFVPASQ